VKIADIKADGTVYWFDRHNDWIGDSLRPDYSRYACVRVDEKRYTTSETMYRPTHRESATGRYALMQEVSETGTPKGQPRAVLATQIRATYAEAERITSDRKAEKDKAASIWDDRVEAARERAAGLTARLASLGVADLVEVKVYAGGWARVAGDRPEVQVSFCGGNHGQADNLEKLLDLIEGRGL
jgi:hypothetical protein